LDTGFSWMDRSYAVARVAAMSEFCSITTDSSMCTPDHCKAWAEKKHETEARLCKDVHWTKEIEEGSVLSCDMYGHDSPPCCGGCIASGALSYFSNGFDAFKSVLGILADVGTLIFSFVAARHIMGASQSKDVVDMAFMRRLGFRSQTANLDFTQPLAANFMEAVFKMSRSKEAVTRTTTAGTSKAWGNGIKDFEIESTIKDWDEFLENESLVLAGHRRWMASVKVPARCLGIMHGERIVAAWTETPMVTLMHILPNWLCSMILLFVLICWPHDGASVALVIPGLGSGIVGRVVSALLASIVCFFISLGATHLCLFTAVQHVVIVTDLRIFYIRHRPQCSILCLFGMQLRIDIFRHDCDVFHGRMRSMNASLLHRFAGLRWQPGDVYLQCKYGMLHLVRARGNALDLFNVISQLTKIPHYLSRQDLEAAGVRWDFCQEWVAEKLKKKSAEVWTIERSEDDFVSAAPEIFVSDSTEHPVFAWSFKEKGELSNPHNVNSDIVVTTGRVLIWSRTLFKSFDCKLCCCLALGGACHCVCCKGVCGMQRLPTSMCFIALSGLMSFTTETTMEPPLWYDPDHPPVKIGCFEALCDNLTRFFTCDRRGFDCSNDETCSFCPRRLGPRSRLSLAWKARLNAQQPDPDLECAIRPYAQLADIGLLTSLGLRENSKASQNSRRLQRSHARRLEVLQRVMGVVQSLSTQQKM